MTQDRITRFVRESNYIEGIHGATGYHVVAHTEFLNTPITVDSLVALVGVLQPDARLRDTADIPGVRVGDHVAPPSGPDIVDRLNAVIAGAGDPWVQHCAYESLHPFSDGNGRSGRAIWLHRHVNEQGYDAHAVHRGFLHSWYYHTLARSGR